MPDMTKFYEIEGNKVTRTHRICPKCGPGVFLADHYDRWTCGSCGYTVYKRKGKKAARRTGPRKRSPRKRSKSR